jgi:glycine cleavage system transcriptional repressor
MTHYLVVTAMGEDRPGLVSRLARLASDCDCNIVDSRMAIFGNEFTLIMMISGAWSAITKIESLLPNLSVELELMTIMKRTSKHTAKNYISRIEVTFTGEDQRGTMQKITEFLAAKNLDLAAVRSHADQEETTLSQSILLAINIPEHIDLQQFELDIHSLAGSLTLQCSIKRMQGIAAP